MPGRVEDQDLYELAATILSSTVDLNKFLKKRKLPSLSFDSPAPTVSLSAENATYHDAKSTILEAAERLIDLVRGPRDTLIELSFQVRPFPSPVSDHPGYPIEFTNIVISIVLLLLCV